MDAVDSSPVFIIGFMAAGKSTVGALLASRLGRRFLDLDQVIEERVGLPVPEIFRQQGESAFRAHESAALADVVAERDVVVAAGGGTPAFGDNLARMRAAGVVVSLTASFESVLARALVPGAPARPLLEDQERARQLYEARARIYADADISIVTDGKDAAAVAEEAARRASLHLGRIDLRVGDRSCPIHVSALSLVGELARERFGAASKLVVVTDSNVEAAGHAQAGCASLLHAGFDASIVTMPAGEEHKTLAELERLGAACLAAGLDRKGAIVAVGGGVVGDVAGFLAASYMRGVPWGVVPTTLLAMIDAAIGGKTAVDLGAGKNMLGAFWQPRFVLADVATLATLPGRERVAAGGEVIKYALLSGTPELELVGLEDPVALVARCAAQKAAVVAADERELTGARATLNLGHTVGHAIEAASWTTGRPLLHGEAVGLGLIAAARVSERAGVGEAGLEVRVTRTCARLGLPVDLDARLGPQVFGLLGTDKKKAGKALGFIVIESPGKVRILPLSVGDIVGFLRANQPG